MTKLQIIYNPAAGGRSRDLSSELAGIFAGLDTDIELRPTMSPGHAVTLARESAASGVKRIVIAGGDGTVNEAINGLAGSGTEMAVLPLGTANVLALELDIPTDLRRAAELAVASDASSVDLGLADERYFILMAGVGFDALVIKNINPLLKRAIRRAAFPLSGLRTFFSQKLSLLDISTEDHTTKGYFVIVSNSRYYGGRFGPNPLASMSDGLLDVCVLKGRTLPEMLNFWLGALRKGTIDSSVAESFRTNELEVTARSGKWVPVQTDGEVVGELPVRISIVPAALKVCAGRKKW
jgi:diacylglycerol kinase (ATP)